MISKTIEAALNEQINRELESAYIYLAMAAWAEHAAFKGFANWFKVQFTEETGHALKFYKYVLDQGGKVQLAGIAKPQIEFKSVAECFEQTLAHEQFITKSINKIADLAVKEGDHATRGVLQWFVDEQIEEEANALELVTKLKMIGTSGSGLLYLDSKLAKRKAGGASE